jgi:hypothetical protein
MLGAGHWLCTIVPALLAWSCLGQGRVTFNFEGFPTPPPGSAVLTSSYTESGMSFVPIFSQGFVRVGASPTAARPDNGSAYLQAGSGSTLKFSFLNGSVFDLLSVDLAEYSTVVPDAVTVRFVGYRQDGSTVMADFITDGIIDGTGPLADFQTFNFGTQFSQLTRVEIPTDGWSLDKLVVSVPEPGSGSILLLGIAVLFFNRRFRRAQGEPPVNL